MISNYKELDTRYLSSDSAIILNRKIKNLLFRTIKLLKLIS